MSVITCGLRKLHCDVGDLRTLYKGKGDSCIVHIMTCCWLFSGVLMCTDVMARGVDFPAVDWVIQFDPPSSAR